MFNMRTFARGFAGAVASAANPRAPISACASVAPPPTGAIGVPGPNTSLGPVKQIDAGPLTIGYAELGPATGAPVVLLHGWPYDIHSYADVAPILAGAGHRVVVPYLRGLGTTRFRAGDTMRSRQQAAVASDITALMDALGIGTAVLGGYDWGARTSVVIAALGPERCSALVSVSGYALNNLRANRQPLAPDAELGWWWYEYYFGTDRGVAGYARYRHDFNKLRWRNASPKWHFDDATYERSASALDGPDHVDIVIHNYRWRLSLAPGDPRYDGLERRLADSPVIGVPTITLASDFGGAAADGRGYRHQFSGTYEHRVLAGVGHNVPRRRPRRSLTGSSTPPGSDDGWNR